MPLKRLIQQSLGVLRTLPGRLFLLSAGLLIVIGTFQATAGLLQSVDIFRKVVVLAFLVSVAWMLWQQIIRTQRQWLWAVRRKLILSYVFFGVFPVGLIMVFVLVASSLLYRTTAAYLFQTGYQRLIDDVGLIAETTAAEIGQNPESAREVMSRKIGNRQSTLPAMSLAMLRRTGPNTFEVTSVGPWRHAPAPTTMPAWFADHPEGFRGSLGILKEGATDRKLVIRSAMASADGQEFVIVDVPVDTGLASRIHDLTGTNIDGITFGSGNGQARDTVSASEQRSFVNFSQTVALMDFTDWTTGVVGRVSVGLEAPVGQLYDRMGSSGSVNGQPLTSGILKAILLVLAGLFLIIQFSAFIGGVTLARRITSAIYHLFYGTARIGQGDFTHRIPIGSNDQLGDLAGSFNNMSASIEHLRHIERDKLRLDEELQIARRIQRSLLPNSVPQIAGLCIADLCEPAMEVGGDYYDFFQLGPRQLGVLVADVSGKGTSAALYMAELKGLMLALSRTHRSPRALLVELNDLLADHLDNRSFITMTYAVIDLPGRHVDLRARRPHATPRRQRGGERGHHPRWHGPRPATAGSGEAFRRAAPRSTRGR